MTNEEIQKRIDSLIHKEKDRKILHRKLIDGITFEALAEEVGMSPRGVQNIVYKYRKLFKE